MQMVAYEVNAILFSLVLRVQHFTCIFQLKLPALYIQTKIVFQYKLVRVDLGTTKSTSAEICINCQTHGGQNK